MRGLPIELDGRKVMPRDEGGSDDLENVGHVDCGPTDGLSLYLDRNWLQLNCHKSEHRRGDRPARGEPAGFDF